MNKDNNSFQKNYQSLNAEQKKAVDTIDGPLLVLAGPGTGKTQLLSARVANILRLTDIAPHNILCLTFTESAASNMRTRLRSLIGQAAYEVTISTYHSFGSEIIRSNSEYFQDIKLDKSKDLRLERPIDELSQLQIVETIISKLPFDNSLLSARYYLGDVVKTIGDLKQHLITPSGLKDVARSNLREIHSAQSVIDDVVNQVGGISRKKGELTAQYKNLLQGLSKLSGSLIDKAVQDLSDAYNEHTDSNSSTPLTAWKNQYLHKNSQDHFTLTNPALSDKMLDLAGVYEAYEQALREQGAYDFSDMIIRAIGGIKKNDELRYNLQERYQYILLDEFQDTNPAQFELVKRLADHPVHEGSPNVMAVGDDDQAIFAFQGANIGNIQDFLDSFKDVKVINLVHNYRSHPDVLHLAQNIAGQVKGRLHTQITGINKILISSSKSLPKKSKVMRTDLSSAADEYGWVSEQISQLISSGAQASEIAVIAPKHSLLENLVPFLRSASIPLSYEKKENILESEVIQNLIIAARLLVALSSQDHQKINEYFPRVLSSPYWGIPPLDIWRTNWQLAKLGETLSWGEIALDNESLKEAVTLYLTLSGTVTTTPLEVILDRLMVETPFKTHYFNKDNQTNHGLAYYEAITYLSTIRTSLRSYQNNYDRALTLTDFLDFVAMYETAGEGLPSTHPISQGKESIKLLTAYKAKGLEFDYVFILQAHDDVWGSTSRGRGDKLALPANLAHIRYTHSGDDERLRLFFVAITRARHGLFICSHQTSDSGKPVMPLKYLGEADGLSPHLPTTTQKIITPQVTTQQSGANLTLLWGANRLSLPVDFRNLLAEKLASYVMSPTHFNTFLDLEYGGPEEFLLKTLLRFPAAPTADSEYGQAIHHALEWYQHKLKDSKTVRVEDVVATFTSALGRYNLTDHELESLTKRGEHVLKKYLPAREEMFRVPAHTEVNFSNEGVVLGEARLTGKIDRLEVDHQNKTVKIVDFKTGKPVSSYSSSLKGYKYRHQLYFYKFLIEGSHTWASYKVEGARLEFVEPNDLKNEDPVAPLTIQFDSAEEQKLKDLIQIVWDKIQKLDLPNTDQYQPTLKGTMAFEQDLLKGRRNN